MGTRQTNSYKSLSVSTDLVISLQVPQVMGFHEGASLLHTSKKDLLCTNCNSADGWGLLQMMSNDNCAISNECSKDLKNNNRREHQVIRRVSKISQVDNDTVWYSWR